MNWRDTAKEWSGVILGITLIVLGSLGFIYLRGEVWHSFSETAVIAGIVTLTVDPFLKKRLIKETSKDIFHHLLGIDLPLAVRDSLSDQLTNTKQYREDVEIDADVRIVGEDAVLTIISRGKVVAVKDCVVTQWISFEESERPRLLEASLTGHPNRKKDYAKKERDLKLIENKKESMVWEWHGPSVDLKKNQKLNSNIKYEITRGPSDFFVLNFAVPAVRPRVRLSASADLLITESFTENIIGNEYTYEKVFLHGDHIQIRWKPKNSVKNGSAQC